MIIMNKCECGNEIHYNTVRYGSGLCRSCSCKERYKIPENNPNFRHGNNIINKKCINCGNKIHPQAIRCGKCEDKHHAKLISGKNNYMFAKHRTEEEKQKLSEKIKNLFKNGRITWNKGLTTKEDKRILGGNKNPAYIHGKSKRKYPNKFSKELKVKILKRDNYTCQKCFIYPTNKLSVHHIDYNKQNCKEDNLITLCRKCNCQVNFNRNKWIKYFLKIIRRNKKWQQLY